jgi:hypothetical protein
MIYSQTGCKIGNNKSLILLNFQLRDRCTQNRCNRNQKTLGNLEDQHATECQRSACSVQNKKFPVCNEIQPLKDKLESDMNERHLTVTAIKCSKPIKYG